MTLLENASIYLKKKEATYFEKGIQHIVTPNPKVSAIQYARSFTDKAGMWKV